MKYATAGILLLGLAISAYPFIAALEPNAKAEAALPRIDISDLKPGSFKFVTNPQGAKWNPEYEEAIFFLARNDGSLKAWYVIRHVNGGVMMPDYQWWRPGWLCELFGPSVKGNSLDENLPIKCHDPKSPSNEWWLPRMQWTLDGKSLDQRGLPDMEEVTGYFDGRYFIYGKSPN